MIKIYYKGVELKGLVFEYATEAAIWIEMSGISGLEWGTTCPK